MGERQRFRISGEWNGHRVEMDIVVRKDVLGVRRCWRLKLPLLWAKGQAFSVLQEFVKTNDLVMKKLPLRPMPDPGGDNVVPIGKGRKPKSS